MSSCYPDKMKDNKQDLNHISLNLFRVRDRGVFRSKTEKYNLFQKHTVSFIALQIFSLIRQVWGKFTVRSETSDESPKLFKITLTEMEAYLKRGVLEQLLWFYHQYI